MDIKAHITGTVWKIELRPGDAVEEEDVILILESMKMEMPVEAPTAGTLSEVLVVEGEPVEEGQVVARLA